MNGKAPVFMVLCLAVAGAMLGASGFADAWGAEPPKTDAAQDELNQSREADPINPGPNSTGVSGPVNGASGSDIVGLIISGAQSLASIVAGVVVLPITLINLGIPAWAAVPIGGLAEVIVGISLIQFVTGRDWR